MKRIRLIIFLALVLLGCVSLARASFFEGVSGAPSLSCEALLIAGGLISFSIKIKRENL